MSSAKWRLLRLGLNELNAMQVVKYIWVAALHTAARDILGART